MENLQNEYDFYVEHRSELLEKYSGKVLAIKDQDVIGVYESELEALEKTSENFQIGTFLIQVCDPTEGSMNHVFQSRAIFT